MSLTKEELQEIKLVMIETVMELVPGIVREELAPIKKELKQLRKDVNQLRKDVNQLRKDVNQLRKDLNQLRIDLDQLRIDLDQLRQDFENHVQSEKRMHQQTQNYIFERTENEYVTKYDYNLQIERIDKIEKHLKNTDKKFIVSDKDDLKEYSANKKT